MNSNWYGTYNDFKVAVALSGAPVSKGIGETADGRKAAGGLAGLVLLLFQRGFAL